MDSGVETTKTTSLVATTTSDRGSLTRTLLLDLAPFDFRPDISLASLLGWVPSALEVTYVGRGRPRGLGGGLRHT